MDAIIKKNIYERIFEMKKLKLFTLVLSVALLVCLCAGFSASAEAESEPTLKISAKNLSFLNTPSMVFAVDYDGVEMDSINLKVWDSCPENDGVEADYIVEEYAFTNNFGSEETPDVLPVFAVKGKNPKDIDKPVWVQAVSGDVKSEIVRYSILEFAFNGMFYYPEMAERFQTVIDYSANVQKWLNYEGTTADNYIGVKFDGLTLDGGDSVILVKDTEIAPVPTTVPSGKKLIGFNVTTTYGVTTQVMGDKLTLDETATVSPLFESVLDFEDGKVPAGINISRPTVAPNTTFTVVDDDTGLNGTKVFKYHYPLTDYTEFNIPRFETTAGANVTIFEADMFFDFDAASTYKRIALRLYIDGYNVDGTGSGAKFFEVDSSGKIFFAGRDLGVYADEWHNFRFEYHYADAANSKLILKVDNEVVYTDENISETGTDLSAKFNMVRFMGESTTGVDLYFDNMIFKTDIIN